MAGERDRETAPRHARSLTKQRAQAAAAAAAARTPASKNTRTYKLRDLLAFERLGELGHAHLVEGHVVRHGAVEDVAEDAGRVPCKHRAPFNLGLIAAKSISFGSLRRTYDAPPTWALGTGG